MLQRYKNEILILLFIFVALALFVSFASATITISNVSPVDGSRHIEIVDNPPDNSGYVNLSFTLTDNTGNTNLEYYLDVFVSGAWVNRQHETDIADGTFYQHDVYFNTTCTDYQWRIHAYDPDDSNWNNATYGFKADCKPDAPSNPSPANNSYQETGNISLSVDVYHQDDASIDIFNVTFFEYPSGRIIGWHETGTGWSNGTTVTCNTSFDLHYNGNKYYWYTRVKDDEYWSDNSSTYMLETYYNDTIEPSTEHYSLGGGVFVEPVYTDAESDLSYYSIGGVINCYYPPRFYYESPTNGSTDASIGANLLVNMYKIGDTLNWDLSFYTNNTLDELWVQIENTQSFSLGGDANNLTIYDDPLSDGTLVGVDTDVNSNLTLDIQVDGNYTLSGNRTSPEYSLSGLAWDNGNILWSEIKPVNTSINIYYDLSTNGGSSWNGWQSASNGGTITGISNGTDMSNYKIKFKQWLSTTDNTTTPQVCSLSLKIKRYTPVSVPSSGLEYDTKYWWNVSVVNTTKGISIMSDTYDFTTGGQVMQEPSSVHYSLGGGVFVEPVYTDSEPSSQYYSLGGVIPIANIFIISNPFPTNGSKDVSINPVLSVWVNKTTPTGATVNFSTNNTYDGSWLEQSSSDITTNTTVFGPLGGLQYNTTYYWKVIARNATTEKSQTEIYHFTTENYTDIEPSTEHYSLGGGIYVEPVYTDSEPSSIYYSLGGQGNVGKPFDPTTPYPANNSNLGQQGLSNFSCYVEDIDNDNMNVTFYNADTGISWASVHSIVSGSRAVTTILPSLTNGSVFNWYVKVDDGDGWNITGSTWKYTPENQAPTTWVTPDDGNSFVQVGRKSIAGAWHTYVKLLANVSDAEHDDVTVKLYIDDPSIGNWNDWILRLSHVDDSYSYYSTTIYRQDETAFDETIKTYHWRLELSDAYNTVNYYMNFTTEFYFWADYSWTPEHPTDDDTVTLIDQSVNATDIRWMVDGETIADANYSSGTHAPFTITRQFNISDLYNISLWVHNDTCDKIDEVHAETTGMHGYLYVDRNVTINDTDGHAGYNYHAYHLTGDINASYLAQNLSLQDGWWLHKYDSINDTWTSYWLFPSASSGIGDNFNISTWDCIVITANQNMQKRINITDDVNASQSKTIVSNYNYLAWSDCDSTTSQNLSIGLSTGDWVYKYNTVADTWAVEWIDMTGDDFTIEGYDILVVYPGSTRNINIG